MNAATSELAGSSRGDAAIVNLAAELWRVSAIGVSEQT